MSEIENVKVKISADTTDINNKVDQTQKKIEKLSAALKDIQGKAIMDALNGKTSKDFADNITKQVESVYTKIRKLRTDLSEGKNINPLSLKEVADDIEKIKGTDAFAEYDRQVAEAKRETNEFLDSAAKAADKLSKPIETKSLAQYIDKLNELQKSITDMTGKLTGALTSGEITDADSINTKVGYLNKLYEKINKLKNEGGEIDASEVESITNAVQDMQNVVYGVTNSYLDLENAVKRLDWTQRRITAGKDAYGNKYSREQIHKMKQEYEELIAKINEYVQAIRDAGISTDEFNKQTKKMGIRNRLEKLGVDYSSFTPIPQGSPKTQRSNPSDGIHTVLGKLSWGTVIKGMLGVRSIYMLIRKIVSQNEQLTQAITNVINVFANILEPVLNLIASILNYLGTQLAGLFNVSTETNKTVERSLASFDELEILNKNSKVEVASIKEALQAFLDKLKEDTEGNENPYKPSEESIEEWKEKWNKFFEWMESDSLWEWGKSTSIWDKLFPNSKLEEWRKNTLEPWLQKDVKDSWNDFWDKAIKGIKESWEKIKTGINNWWTGTVKPNFTALWDDMKSRFFTPIDNIFKKISDWIDKITEKLGINKTNEEAGITDENGKITQKTADETSVYAYTPTDATSDKNKKTTSAVEVNTVANAIKETAADVVDRLKNNLKISLPSFATGAVLTSPTIAMVGDASTPEIVTPQSLLKETIDSSNTQVVSALAQMTRQIITSIENVDMQVSIGDDVIAKSAARGNNSYKMRTGRALI